MTADFRKAECEAAGILKKYNITEPFVDLHKITRGEGLHIAIVQLKPEWENNISGFYDDGTKTIYVNRNISAARTRFTIAHELGHYLMHKDYIKSEKYKVLMRRNDWSINDKPDVEKEADAFAANLLVPLEILEKYRDKATVPQLKDLFGISEEMLGYRLILHDRKNHSSV